MFVARPDVCTCMQCWPMSPVSGSLSTSPSSCMVKIYAKAYIAEIIRDSYSFYSFYVTVGAGHIASC